MPSGFKTVVTITLIVFLFGAFALFLAKEKYGRKSDIGEMPAGKEKTGGVGKINDELDTDSDGLPDEIGNASFFEKSFGPDQNLPLSAPTPAPNPSPSGDLPPLPAILKEEAVISKDWKYALYVPSAIDAGKEYPLLIGLHDFGEKAKDYISLWRPDAEKNKFIVVVLQTYSKKYPGGTVNESYPWAEIAGFANAALSDIKKNYKIDESRIFLTGYSSGASASYIAALKSGIRFKGVISVSGHLPLEAGIVNDLKNAKDVNFYVVHGVDDVDAAKATEQEKTLLQYGAKMEFKILTGVGRDYPLAEHENIAEWMNSLP